MLLFEDYWKKIFESIQSAYPEVTEGDIALDRSGHCDLAFRAFQVMKKRSLTPDAIYSKVKELFGSSDFIENIESVGGYVNFTFRPSSLMEAIWKEMEGTNQYPDTFQDPERVSVEHTSTNPTGPIHIGRIRNSIIGDSLARLVARYGYRVTTQYFVNDSGRQVASLFAGYRKFIKVDTPTAYDLLEGYKKATEEMEKGSNLNEEVDQIIRDYEKGEPSTIEGIKKVCSIILDSINTSLSNLGIKIDDYTWESDLIRTGDVERIMEDLEEELLDENGAKYLMSNGRKMFLTRKDGTSLYFSRDIAYHLYKFQNFDWLIDVLGENHKEHAGHIEYVTKTLLNQEHKLDFVFYSYVSLETGKMSTRKGQIITLDELYERALEESFKIVKEKRPELPQSKLKEIAASVAVSAIRFHILKLNSNKPMVFKWSEALNLEGDSAPFVMYSYARASSIMRKLEDQSHSLGKEYNRDEASLIRQMYLYPYVLTESLKGLKPENVANYLLELTRRFNDFYTNCPVLNAGPGEKERRVMIINAYRTIVKDAANIVGLKILEEM